MPTRSLSKNIVDFLSFSEDAPHCATNFYRFRPRQWEHALEWMNDAGIALYFLRKLRQTNAAGAIPPWVLSRLENDLAANQRRVEYMSGQFGFLNQKFSEAGVRYLAIKGFSLVPQFCPDAVFRHQSDFDYLIHEQSLPAARQVLEKAGYAAKPSCDSKEFNFVSPGALDRPFKDKRYDAGAHAVELHLDIWDESLHQVALPSDLFNVARSRECEWNGSVFPGLSDPDTFLLLVLHAWHHLFMYWIRLSWLLEIGYFLNYRSSDDDLWAGVERRVGNSTVLQEFVVIIAELAASLFAAPWPPLVRAWRQKLRPAPKIWMENYARHWVFSEVPAFQFSLFPRAKLVLFLQRQYVGDGRQQKRMARSQLFSIGRYTRIARSIAARPAIVMDMNWWKRQLLFRRTLFHALAGFRYLCEIPRWRWLNWQAQNRIGS